MRKRLQWERSAMGELEARDGQFRYVVWHNPKANTTEVRLIRYDQVAEGMMVPFYDYSVYVKDIDSALRFAEKFNRMLYKVRKYNGFSTLSK